jgi:hypothetical protein
MADSDELIDAFLHGRRVRDKHLGITLRQYLEPGSQEERDARSALVALLSGDRELTSQVRRGLALLITPDENSRPHEMIIRRRHPSTPMSRDEAIAYQLAKRLVVDRVLLKTAKQEYDVSLSTVDRAWRHYGSEWVGFHVGDL